MVAARENGNGPPHDMNVVDNWGVRDRIGGLSSQAESLP